MLVEVGKQGGFTQIGLRPTSSIREMLCAIPEKIIDIKLYFCYTLSMKTAISIPDNLFTDAEITAKQLGLARSQLYVRAIKEFIEHHNKDKITENLNKIYSNAVAENELNDAGIESIREATKNDTW